MACEKTMEYWRTQSENYLYSPIHCVRSCIYLNSKHVWQGSTLHVGNNTL